MKKLILPILIILFITFFACKKKESAPPSTNTSTTGGSTTGGTTTGGGDWGVFSSIYNTTNFGNNVIYNDSVVQATFYDSPASTHTIISAGNVVVNTVTLFPFSNNVYNSSNQINLKTLNWQLSGSGTISASSFSYSPTYPIYTGFNLLPADTVYKSTGFTFTVTGITNNSTLPFYITIGQSGMPITKTITTLPATVTISPSDLASFSTGSSLVVRLSFINYSNITVSTYKYAINANRTYIKYSYLKP